jgi:hypothetical protein
MSLPYLRFMVRAAFFPAATRFGDFLFATISKPPFIYLNGLSLLSFLFRLSTRYLDTLSDFIHFFLALANEPFFIINPTSLFSSGVSFPCLIF